MNLNELNEKYTKNMFFSKIKGVTMQPDRQDNIKNISQAQKIFWFLEDNPVDPNAIRLYGDEAKTKDLGYISKELAPDLRDFLHHGIDFEIRAAQITGGIGTKSFGCNILIILKRDWG
jgi:hypothetical protein